MLPFLAVALAAPTVLATPDGAVRATVHVDAPATVEHDLLADGGRAVRLSPDVRTAFATADGTCQRVDLTNRTIVGTFTTTTRRCPVTGGFRETLVTSDLYLRWDGVWEIVPDGSGTRVTATYDVQLDLPVPSASVRSRTARALAALEATVAPATARVDR